MTVVSVSLLVACCPYDKMIIATIEMVKAIFRMSGLRQCNWVLQPGDDNLNMKKWWERWTTSSNTYIHFCLNIIVPVNDKNYIITNRCYWLILWEQYGLQNIQIIKQMAYCMGNPDLVTSWLSKIWMYCLGISRKRTEAIVVGIIPIEIKVTPWGSWLTHWLPVFQGQERVDSRR